MHAIYISKIQFNHSDIDYIYNIISEKSCEGQVKQNSNIWTCKKRHSQYHSFIMRQKPVSNGSVIEYQVLSSTFFLEPPQPLHSMQDWAVMCWCPQVAFFVRACHYCVCEVYARFLFMFKLKLIKSSESTLLGWDTALYKLLLLLLLLLIKLPATHPQF